MWTHLPSFCVNTRGWDCWVVLEDRLPRCFPKGPPHLALQAAVQDCSRGSHCWQVMFTGWFLLVLFESCGGIIAVLMRVFLIIDDVHHLLPGFKNWLFFNYGILSILYHCDLSLSGMFSSGLWLVSSCS